MQGDEGDDHAAIRLGLAYKRVRNITSERKEIGVTRYTGARRKFGLRIRDQRQKLHMTVHIPSRIATATKYPSLVSHR
ncbi:hypothetical protein Y032_0098g3063 [Ancylostoma ceylanicum]|uniref:Uncharacterized protein n=1 Tax=Ancylostoma ceylanicum TaxID=53326 RepID=A0A016TJC0_9BILA|nr:hypothetical protein Y032_0098g3063 [Ancylostoma ceylanicum]